MKGPENGFGHALSRGRVWRFVRRPGAAWPLVVGWLMAGLILKVFSVDLDNALFVVSLPLYGAYWAGGVVVAALVLFPTKSAALEITRIPPVLVLVAGGASLWVWGPELGTRLRFELARPEFMEVVQAVEAAGADDELVASMRSEGILVEAGPPIRVAFPWYLGITDNWSGMVYDPTGFVMKTQEFRGWSNWDAPELQEVKKLFGGDLMGCRPVRAPWYLCSFT